MIKPTEKQIDQVVGLVESFQNEDTGYMQTVEIIAKRLGISEDDATEFLDGRDVPGMESADADRMSCEMTNLFITTQVEITEEMRLIILEDLISCYEGNDDPAFKREYTIQDLVKYVKLNIRQQRGEE